MSRLADLQSFVRTSERAQSPQDLFDLLQSISQQMGFDHFALVHHVDLRPAGKLNDHLVTSDFAVLSDYPQFWVDQYISDAIVTDDPLLIASQRMASVFEWQEMLNLLPLTAAQREITERTRHAGLENGFTIPLHVPGEINGSCHFAVATGHELPRNNMYMAQSVGTFAFQAARNLMDRLRGTPLAPPPKLTGRQLECVVLAGRGKSNWEIGVILGISQETVKQHLSDAQSRYDVGNRMQLVTRALFDGQFSVVDLVR